MRRLDFIPELFEEAFGARRPVVAAQQAPGDFQPGVRLLLGEARSAGTQGRIARPMAAAGAM